MSISIGLRVGDIAVGASLASRGERTQEAVDAASQSLSDVLHDSRADEGRRLDRPGALDSLLNAPGPLDRLAARRLALD